MDLTILEKFILPIATLLISFVFSLVTAYFVSQREVAKLREEKKIRQEEEVKRYWQPILKAAGDLQDRLWHLTQVEAKKREGKTPVLLKQDENQVDNPKWPMTKKDYMTSTLYYFAQYFAWIEILRQETQFIDIGKNEDTRHLHAALRDIEISLSNTGLQWGLEELGAPAWLMECNLQTQNSNKISSDRPIFRFQQAVIGQSLINTDSGKLSCSNYLEFKQLYETALKDQPDVACLRELILRAVTGETADFSLARCCILANRLVDLMNLLDPDKKFVFSGKRAYVKVPGFQRVSSIQ